MLDDKVIEMLNNILTTCDIVQISVDNSLRNNTSKQRGLTPEQSETLINAIKGVSKCNFLTIVNITPTSMNQYEILNIIDEVVNLGINTLSATPFTQIGGAADNASIVPDYKVLAHEHKKAQVYAKDNGMCYLGGIDGHPCQSVIDVKNSNDDSNKKLTYRSCDAASYNIHINNEGDVFPCVFMEYKEFFAGNLLLDDLNSIRRKLEDVGSLVHSTIPAKCKNCSIINACGGGCPGVIWNTYRNFNRRDPRCNKQ